MPHVCPKCTYEHPCFFSEGEIVALADEAEANAPAPWTGIVLDVERDKAGPKYRVLWGDPPVNLPPRTTARHSGEHRGEELQRFLVPLPGAPSDARFGGGSEREALPRRFGARP